MRLFKFKISKGDWFKAAAVTISLALFLSASFATAFFWMIFLVWWAFRLDSRVVGISALLFLIIIPVLLALKQDARAEQIAVYTFFLLCITVALQIIELVRDGETPEEDTEEKSDLDSRIRGNDSRRKTRTPAEPPVHVLNLKKHHLDLKKQKVVKVDFTEKE